MRAARFVVLTGGCAAVITAGFVAAPDPISAPPSTSASPPSSDGVRTFDGPSVRNVRGAYQARITVDAGVVVAVEALQAGTAAADSVRVNTMAIPVFRERVLAAQTWDVGPVSGASYTSPAFLESLQGAFEKAGL